MKIEIESTEKLTTLDGVPVRVWRGRTEAGIECVVFVHRIAVKNVVQDYAAFDREMKEQLPPAQMSDLRKVL